MPEPFSDRRVLVTGGSGFLGRRVVARLRAAGADVVAPRSAEYDLTQAGAAEDMLRDLRPATIVHLAARVGGIGFNQAEPAPLYLANLLMGTHVIEAARHAPGVEMTVLLGTVCSYPEVHAGPVPRGEPVGRVPGGDQRPVRAGEEGPPRARPGERRAVRPAVLLPHPDQPLRARRQVPPGGVARDPGADQEVRRGGRARRGEGRGVGHRAGEPGVPLRRRCRRGDRARRRHRGRAGQRSRSRSTSAPTTR